MLWKYWHFNHLIKNQSLIVPLQFVRVVLWTIFCQEQNIALAPKGWVSWKRRTTWRRILNDPPWSIAMAMNTTGVLPLPFGLASLMQICSPWIQVITLAFYHRWRWLHRCNNKGQYTCFMFGARVIIRKNILLWLLNLTSIFIWIGPVCVFDNLSIVSTCWKFLYYHWGAEIRLMIMTVASNASLMLAYEFFSSVWTCPSSASLLLKPYYGWSLSFGHQPLINNSSITFYWLIF